MKTHLKSNKGITMVVLTIAIITLAIVTSMLVYYSSDAIDIKNLNNMYNDIELLSQKVSMYFYENDKIPILTEYVDAEDILGNQKGNMDNNTYYVIDLSKLENLELNFGKEFKGVKSTYSSSDFDITEYTDIYIINEQSHNIYYVKGIKVDEKTYHKKSLTDSDELIDIKATKISSIEDLIRFGQSVTNGETYENKYVIMTKNLDFENANSYDGTEVSIDTVVYTYGGENDLKTYLCEETGWTPIGNQTNSFLGTFEGNNYKIINIYSATEANKKLFGTTTGTIRNVDVEWK